MMGILKLCLQVNRGMGLRHCLLEPRNVILGVSIYGLGVARVRLLTGMVSFGLLMDLLLTQLVVVSDDIGLSNSHQLILKYAV